MARTIDDVLARRTRLLFLDAKAALECSEKVGRLLAEELNYNEDWKVNEVNDFKKIAKGYFF